MVGSLPKKNTTCFKLDNSSQHDLDRMIVGSLSIFSNKTNRFKPASWRIPVKNPWALVKPVIQKAWLVPQSLEVKVGYV